MTQKIRKIQKDFKIKTGGFLFISLFALLVCVACHLKHVLVLLLINWPTAIFLKKTEKQKNVHLGE